jgi:hypothetical protein
MVLEGKLFAQALIGVPAHNAATAAMPAIERNPRRLNEKCMLSPWLLFYVAGLISA